MSRSLLALSCASALVLAAVLARSAGANDRFAGVKIESVPVSAKVHMLTGRGGNIAVLSGGPDGVLLVDDQFAPLSDKIRAAVSALDDGAIRFVLNTHHHGDHTGGNESFGGSGSVIVAHAGVRLRLAAELGEKAQSHPSLPIVTFENSLTVHLNGVDVRVVHMPKGHTDGDAVVWFDGENAVHLGDLYFNGKYPYIDVDSGGSVAGLISAIESVLAEVHDTTAIIPGHGSLSNKSELATYLALIKTVRDRVQAQIDSGANVDATIAAKPTAEFDAEWDGGFIATERFIRIVYRSLSAAP